MITNKLDDLHGSVNDIYTQWDEGCVEYNDAVEILNRVCNEFTKALPQPDSGQVLDHKIFFKTASDCHLWLEENEIYNPVTLTIHLGETV